MRVPATKYLYEFDQLKMGVVLIKWAWPKLFSCAFRAHCYCYNPTIVIILDPPVGQGGQHSSCRLSMVSVVNIV